MKVELRGGDDGSVYAMHAPYGDPHVVTRVPVAGCRIQVGDVVVTTHGGIQVLGKNAFSKDFDSIKVRPLKDGEKIVITN